MLFSNAPIRVLVFLCAVVVTLNAQETVTYKVGDIIDVPLMVSTASNVQSRTLYFPALIREALFPGAETTIPLQHVIVRNTLTVTLVDPSFEMVVPIGDETGNLYPVRFRPAGEGEDATAPLQVTLDLDAGNAGEQQSGAWPEDTDSASVALMRAMVTQRIPADIRVTPIVSKEGDEVVRGKSIFEDDLMTFRAMYLFRSPNLDGHMLELTWKGQQAVRIDARKLWFPGALWVYMPMEFIRNGPYLEYVLRPNVPTPVYFISHQQ